jgi:hypothetical protein
VLISHPKTLTLYHISPSGLFSFHTFNSSTQKIRVEHDKRERFTLILIPFPNSPTALITRFVETVQIARKYQDSYMPLMTS